MKLHKEVSFEDEICAHLSANGWLYDHSDASSYDRARALFTADLLAWVKATQPKSWEAFAKNHGNSAEGVLLDRVRNSSMTAAPSCRRRCSSSGLETQHRLHHGRRSRQCRPTEQQAR